MLQNNPWEGLFGGGQASILPVFLLLSVYDTENTKNTGDMLAWDLPPGGYFGATIIHQEGYASRGVGDRAIGWMPALLLCPKCGSQSIGLVPKRTIPLGGTVALGRFPQEEWFPPPLIWHRKGRQRGEHRRRKTKNRTSFQFENMKSIRTRVGRVLPNLQRHLDRASWSKP